MTFPPLDTAVVRVWTVPLTLSARTLATCEAIVAGDELRRADAFREIDDRRRYLAAHAALRLILGQCVDELPSSLRFGLRGRGKPYLPDHPWIRFNLSHAGEIAMIAVARDRDVGIDVEIVRDDVDVDGVSRQAFAAAEQAELLRLDSDERVNAFYRIWTRKEAYIKALGFGLSYPTAGFTVSPCIGSSDALLSDEALAHARDHWRVADVAAPTGYSAALAAKGRGWHFAMHSYCTIEWMQLRGCASGEPCRAEPTPAGFPRSFHHPGGGTLGDTNASN